MSVLACCSRKSSCVHACWIAAYTSWAAHVCTETPLVCLPACCLHMSSWSCVCQPAAQTSWAVHLLCSLVLNRLQLSGGPQPGCWGPLIYTYCNCAFYVCFLLLVLFWNRFVIVLFVYRYAKPGEATERCHCIWATSHTQAMEKNSHHCWRHIQVVYSTIPLMFTIFTFYFRFKSKCNQRQNTGFSLLDVGSSL